MRIINQRYDASLNFDHINLFRAEGVIYTVLDGKNCILGRYASEKRAKEVFGLINDAYDLNVYIMPEE